MARMLKGGLRALGAGVLLALAAGVFSAAAQAGCSCGFTPAQRATADKELWLNKRDQNASIAQHLPWGLPQTRRGGYVVRELVQRDYVTGYSTELAIPVWTAHKLTAKTLAAREKAKKSAADPSRKSCFRADPRLTNEETAVCSNYEEPVFDQGHLVPDADMPAKPIASLVNSYVFSNIAPQYCHFNRGVWLFAEGMVRAWAKEKGEVNVISGAVFDKDRNDRPDATDAPKRLKPNKFGAAPAIATHFYKVVLHKGEDGAIEAIAILLPHNNEERTRQQARDYLQQHIVSIDAIEKVAGVDLPPHITGARAPGQESVERLLAPELWETEGGLPSTFDGACKDG